MPRSSFVRVVLTVTWLAVFGGALYAVGVRGADEWPQQKPAGQTLEWPPCWPATHC